MTRSYYCKKVNEHQGHHLHQLDWLQLLLLRFFSFFSKTVLPNVFWKNCSKYECIKKQWIWICFCKIGEKWIPDMLRWEFEWQLIIDCVFQQEHLLAQKLEENIPDIKNDLQLSIHLCCVLQENDWFSKNFTAFEILMSIDN